MDNGAFAVFKYMLQENGGTNGDSNDTDYKSPFSKLDIILQDQYNKRMPEDNHVFNNTTNKRIRCEDTNNITTGKLEKLKDYHNPVSSMSILQATLASAKNKSESQMKLMKLKRPKINARCTKDSKGRNTIDIVNKLVTDLDIDLFPFDLEDDPYCPPVERDIVKVEDIVVDSLTEGICQFLASEISNEDKDIPTECKLGHGLLSGKLQNTAELPQSDDVVVIKQELHSSGANSMPYSSCDVGGSSFARPSECISPGKYDAPLDDSTVAAPLDGGPVGHWPSPLTDGWLVGSRPGIAEYQARARAKYYGYDYEKEKSIGVVLPHVEFVDTYNSSRSPSQACLDLAEDMGSPLKLNGLDDFWVLEKRRAYLQHLDNNVVIKSFIDGDISTIQFIGLLRSMATELLRPTMHRLSLDFSSTTVKLSKEDAIPYDWKVVKLMLQGNRAQNSMEQSPIVRPHSLHSEGNPSNNFFNQFFSSNVVCMAPTINYYGRILDVTAAKEYGAIQSLICAIVIPCLIDEVLDLGPDEKELIDSIYSKRGDCELPTENDRMDAIHCCVSCAIHSLSYAFVGGEVSDRSWSPSSFPKSMIHSAMFRAPLTLPLVDANPPFDSSKCPELRIMKNDVILLLNPPSNGKTPEAKAKRAVFTDKKNIQKGSRVLCKLGNGISATVGVPREVSQGNYRQSSSNGIRKNGTLTCQRMMKRAFISIVGSYGRLHLVTGRINRVYTAFMDKSRDTLRGIHPVMANCKLDSIRQEEDYTSTKHIVERLKRLGIDDILTPQRSDNYSVSDNVFFTREDNVNIFHCKGLYRVFGLVPESKHMDLFRNSRHLFQLMINWQRVEIIHDAAVSTLTQLLDQIGQNHSTIDIELGNKGKIRQVSVRAIQEIRGQCMSNNNPDIIMADMRRQAASFIAHLHKISIRQHVRTGRIRGAEMSTLWFRPYDMEANVKLAEYEANDKSGHAMMVAMVDGGEIESLARDMFPRPARHIMLELLVGKNCALAISALSCKQWYQWSYDMLTRRRNRTYHSAKISDAEKDEACYGIDSDLNMHPITFYKYTLLRNTVSTKRGRIGLQEIQSMASKCLVGLYNEPIVRLCLF
nr:MAG: wsv226-like protein [Penaeus semisulcatus pemonivirus]